MRNHLFYSLFFFCICIFSSACAEVQIRNLSVQMPNCPADLQELRIALIADLHLTGENFQQNVFQETADKLNQQKPHIILIAGDFFHYTKTRKKDDMAAAWNSMIKKISPPPLGIYAVLGNHDHSFEDEPEIREILEHSGVHLLREQIVRIPFSRSALFLAGTEQESGENLSGSFFHAVSVSLPCIMLAHVPEVYDKIPDDFPVLMLAGHTHGGVIRIPGMRDGALMGVLSPAHWTKYPYGYFAHGRKKLYVTSGIGGESLSRHRINNPPEIVIIRLK